MSRPRPAAAKPSRTNKQRDAFKPAGIGDSPGSAGTGESVDPERIAVDAEDPPVLNDAAAAVLARVIRAGSGKPRPGRREQPDAALAIRR